MITGKTPCTPFSALLILCCHLFSNLLLKFTWSVMIFLNTFYNTKKGIQQKLKVKRVKGFQNNMNYMCSAVGRIVIGAENHNPPILKLINFPYWLGSNFTVNWAFGCNMIYTSNLWIWSVILKVSDLNINHHVIQCWSRISSEVSHCLESGVTFSIRAIKLFRNSVLLLESSNSLQYSLRSRHVI